MRREDFGGKFIDDMIGDRGNGYRWYDRWLTGEMVTNGMMGDLGNGYRWYHGWLLTGEMVIDGNNGWLTVKMITEADLKMKQCTVKMQ